MRAQRKGGEEAEQHRAAQVDHQRAEREWPGQATRHRAVDEEAQHRPGAAEQHHTDPHRDGHGRIRTRRTSAVATYTANSPATMLVAV